jgi:hypothetical protein
MIDEPLGCLLSLIWLPYRIWKAMCAESFIGTSELDRQAGRFWKGFAVVASLVVILGLIVWILLAYINR